MKKKVSENSLVQLVEDMIMKDETLLLSYTVDELIEMAANGKEIKFDGCSTDCHRFPKAK